MFTIKDKTYRLKSGEALISFYEKEEKLYQNLFDIDSNLVVENYLPPFRMKIAGISDGGFGGSSNLYTVLPNQMKLISKSLTNEQFEFVLFHEITGIEVMLSYIAIDEANGFVCNTIVKNTGQNAVCITFLSSVSVNGICTGEKSSYDAEKTIIH